MEEIVCQEIRVSRLSYCWDKEDSPNFENDIDFALSKAEVHVVEASFLICVCTSLYHDCSLVSLHIVTISVRVSSYFMCLFWLKLLLSTPILFYS